MQRKQTKERIRNGETGNSKRGLVGSKGGGGGAEQRYGHFGAGHRAFVVCGRPQFEQGLPRATKKK